VKAAGTAAICRFTTRSRARNFSGAAYSIRWFGSPSCHSGGSVGRRGALQNIESWDIGQEVSCSARVSLHGTVLYLRCGRGMARNPWPVGMCEGMQHRASNVTDTFKRRLFVPY